uniref:Integrase catalytic domain-containing protein n=1 Tax=Nicotiana tabacum TaxID=4097 RepID=A0A1S3Y072_TOBAC|nr:PREDICTED: uncharacterized protein LOC107770648 [Nicotiana tabacum]
MGFLDTEAICVCEIYKGLLRADYGRDSLVMIFYSPWIDKDVKRAPETRRISSKHRSSNIEMGDDQYGFIIGLPRSYQKFDSIWVIVDMLTKSSHFLPVRTTYAAEDYARLYINEIVRLHGVLISIVYDRGSQFMANFWRSFQSSLGT